MSLKVIRTDTDRSATFYFILTFHSNQGLSRAVPKIKNGFSLESQFFHRSVFNAPTEGVPVGIG